LKFERTPSSRQQPIDRRAANYTKQRQIVTFAGSLRLPPFYGLNRHSLDHVLVERFGDRWPDAESP
jgi:hypothetical protein